MTVYVHLAGTAASSRTVEKYDDSGSNTAIWTANHGDLVYAVKADSQGNVYTGGLLSGGYTLRKYDKDGAFLWGVNTGGRVYCLGIDSEDSVYTGGIDYSGHNCCKYNSAGTKQWGFDDNRDIWAIAIDSDDDIYFAGAYTTYDVKKVSKLNSSIWTRNYHTTTIYALAVDAAKNIYLGGSRRLNVTYKNIRKYNSSGVEQWSADHGTAGIIYGIGLDTDGNLYAGGNAVSSVTTRKYDSTGTEVITGWRKNNAAEVRALFVNQSDNTIYTTGVAFFAIPPSAWFNTRKYNSSGTELYKIGTSNSRQAIHVVNLDSITIAPPVYIGFDVYAPFQSIYNTANSISFDFAIASPAVPPIVAAPYLTGKIYYTLIMTGQSDLLYLPLVDLQCQRRLGASTWLTTTTLLLNQDQADSVIARHNNGAQLIVMASGDLGAGEFIRAWSSELEIAKTEKGIVAKIKSRVVPTAFSQQTRNLVGIRSLSVENGRKTAICSIDFLLRPNDIADDGESQWTAGAILFKIFASDSYMTVVEAT